MSNTVEKAMIVSYIRQLSVGEIIRYSFQIYRANFRVLFACWGLVYVPIFAVVVYADNTGLKALYWATLFASVFPSVLGYAALTLSISDACIGNRPGIVRAYSQFFSPARLFSPVGWRLAGLSFIHLTLVALGLVMLIVPGVLFICWFIFAPLVVVLEGSSGLAALKRSKVLVQGYAWRNLGVFLVMFALIEVVVIGCAAAFAIIVFLLNSELPRWLIQVISVLPGAVVQPIVFVSLVLMYYDLRARKEGFDSIALAEELRR